VQHLNRRPVKIVALVLCLTATTFQTVVCNVDDALYAAEGITYLIGSLTGPHCGDDDDCWEDYYEDHDCYYDCGGGWGFDFWGY
jgi:hypothetical protein